MMTGLITELRCLYLEHEEPAAATIADAIKTAWHRETGLNATVEVVALPEEAKQILRLRANDYHLFVADILFDVEDPLGLAVIGEAALHQHLAILAFSQGDTLLRQQALDAGADEFISKKAHRFDPQLRRLGQTLVAILAKKGQRPIRGDAGRVRYDVDDLVLSALVDEVGRGNLYYISSKLARRECEEVQLELVREGASGAAVIRAECELHVEPGHAGESKSLLLKLSRMVTLLQKEIEGRRQAATFPSGLFVQWDAEHIIETDGWFAIGASFQSGAMTLREWLQNNSHTEQEVARALSSLLLVGGLGDVYKNTSLNPDARASDVLWKHLTPGRRARVQRALKDLRRLATSHNPQGSFDSDLLDRFIRTGRFGEIDKDMIPVGVRVSRGHGDLHSANVLIDRHGVAKLIDPAEIAEFHWAFDVARLEVDVLLTVLDSGDEAHEWAIMEEWVAMAATVIEGAPISGAMAGRNAVGASAIDWLRSNLPQILGGVWVAGVEWQFMLALAIEFLRAAGRRADLPTPKRVLALHGACLAMRRSALLAEPIGPR